MHHNLKIEPAYYEAVESDDKTFEIRFNDRGFQKGDTVTLTKYSPGHYFGGQLIDVVITYVTTYQQRDGWVVFGIKKQPKEGE